MASAASLMWTKNIAKWRNAKYLIFDLPNDSNPFEQRVQNMMSLKLKYKNFNFLEIIKQEVCTGIANL